MANDVKLDMRALEKLIKNLEKSYFVRVGVLGDGSGRSVPPGAEEKITDKTNAEIGLIHEEGLGNNPIRSWLRMPLETVLPRRFKKLVALGTFKELLQSDDGAKIFFNQIGELARDTILEAFKTGGFGTWAPSNMKRKKVHQTLVETQQLRDSVVYVVKEGSK